MKKLKLTVEFILWEIRRIFRFIEKCLKSIPFLALFLVLWYYFGKYLHSMTAGFSFSFFTTFTLWLIVRIIKNEWDKFMDYKRWLKRRK